MCDWNKAALDLGVSQPTHSPTCLGPGYLRGLGFEQPTPLKSSGTVLCMPDLTEGVIAFSIQ